MSLIHSETNAGISRRRFLQLGAGLTAGALLGSGSPLAAQSGGDQLIQHVHTNARKVCLTYDDLWSEHFALRIGKEFYKRGIRLTFFPIGYAVLNNLEKPLAGYENLYPRLRDMGHEFGCHLFTHRVPTDFSLQQLIDEEMEPTLWIMRRALGPNFQPVGIRPPYGIVTDPLRELSARYDIPLILWGIDSQDALCTMKLKEENCSCADLSSDEVYSRLWNPGSHQATCSKESCAKTCVESMLNNYRSYLRPGSIILHHAIQTSYLAISPILELLDNWNMQPIRLSELLTYMT